MTDAYEGPGSFERHLQSLLREALRSCPPIASLVLADAKGLPVCRAGPKDVRGLTAAAMAAVADAAAHLMFRSFGFDPAEVIEVRNAGWKVVVHRRTSGGLTALAIAPATTDSLDLELAVRGALAAVEDALLEAH